MEENRMKHVDITLFNKNINRIRRRKRRKIIFEANCEEENCSRVKDAGCAGSRPRGLKTHQFESQPFNPNYRMSERTMLLDK